MPDTSPETQYLVILIVNDLMWKLMDAYLQLQKNLAYFLKVFMLT